MHYQDGTALNRLPEVLNHILQHLSQNPSPFVPTPEQAKKRASVALILRIRPAYKPWPLPSILQDGGALDDATRLKNFFEQDWVRSGDPEALFIKRSSRQGDRWQGHVALPGGGKDPEDEDDQATAVRETAEEVGVDLRPEAGYAIAVGNLPQRVVTTSWVRSMWQHR